MTGLGQERTRSANPVRSADRHKQTFATPIFAAKLLGLSSISDAGHLRATDGGNGRGASPCCCRKAMRLALSAGSTTPPTRIFVPGT
jgi:hypothetical protein